MPNGCGLQASVEEAYLTEKFGSEYEELIKTTKKFIPGEACG